MTKRRTLYLGGSMRNARIPDIAQAIRALGYDVFDDWFSPGEQADDKWQEYEKRRGRSFAEALKGWHAEHVFEIDKRHLDRCDVFVLVMPAGRSAHIELGYMSGQGKECYVLFDGEPERFDMMYQFATDIFFKQDDLLEALR